jgi:hypothetical protein
MTFALGANEWISDIVDTSFGISLEGEDLGKSSVYPASVMSASGFVRPGVKSDDVPSILGASFWSHCKGLVFDYTPCEERVGLVPRLKLMDKSGLLNPTFVSAAERTSAVCAVLLLFCSISFSSLLM